MRHFRLLKAALSTKAAMKAAKVGVAWELKPALGVAWCSEVSKLEWFMGCILSESHLIQYFCSRGLL